MKLAKWRKGKREIRGRYFWSWSRQRFRIILDDLDPITGRRRDFETSDSPDFNGWIHSDVADVAYSTMKPRRPT